MREGGREGEREEGREGGREGYSVWQVTCMYMTFAAQNIYILSDKLLIDKYNYTIVLCDYRYTHILTF